MAKRYRRLRGQSAYYPFAARATLRAKQRRHAHRLWAVGLAALGVAAVLLVRQTVFRGGQPTPPVQQAVAVVQTPEQAQTPQGPAPGDAPDHRITVQPLAATQDALAQTRQADDEAHALPQAQATPAPAAVAQVLPQYQALYEQNPELIGWLSLPAAGIDLPVMQTPGDNEYYLRRGFDRLYATGGTLFLDERCSADPAAPTANWLVYGHNMADGSMFGGLTQYREEAFYRANPTFRFDTLYATGTWQIVAALDTTLGADELPYYTFFDADTKLEWQQRVDAILALALYDTGVTPHYGDQLLVLSTCGDSGLYTDTRFALLAVRVGE